MRNTQTENNLRREIEQGLRRLAFGGVCDSVHLLLKSEELSPRRLKKLDLFNVAGLKRGAGGVTEVKFYDRIKALEKLMEFDLASGGSQLGLIEALQKSAERGEN